MKTPAEVGNVDKNVDDVVENINEAKNKGDPAPAPPPSPKFFLGNPSKDPPSFGIFLRLLQGSI